MQVVFFSMIEKYYYCVTSRETCWIQRSVTSHLETKIKFIVYYIYPENFPDSYRKSPTKCQLNWDTLFHHTILEFSLSWIRRGLSYKVWFNSMSMRWTLPNPYLRIPYSPGTRPSGDIPQSIGHIPGPPHLSTSLLVTEWRCWKLNHKTCFLVIMSDVRPFLQFLFTRCQWCTRQRCTRQSLASSHATSCL